MAPSITCVCGTCAKCKHRAYMREWYRRGDNAERHHHGEVHRTIDSG